MVCRWTSKEVFCALTSVDLYRGEGEALLPSGFGIQIAVAQLSHASDNALLFSHGTARSPPPLPLDNLEKTVDEGGETPTLSTAGGFCWN
jgi:hypothetical protein